MINERVSIENIEKEIGRQGKILSEMESFLSYSKNSKSPKEREMINSQINVLFENLKKSGQSVMNNAEQISMTNQLSQNPSQQNQNQNQNNQQVQNNQQRINSISAQNLQTSNKSLMGPSGQQNEKEEQKKENPENELTDIEKLSVTRQRGEKEKVVKKKGKRPSGYIKISSKYFYNLSASFLKRGFFRDLKRDMVRGNLDFVPAAYISTIFFSTMVAGIIGILAAIFLSIFTVTFSPPFIVGAEGGFLERFLKFFWIIILLPLATFIFGYTYPGLERKSLERKIDYELPFATINMSAISNSMIEPSKIFGILVSTGEYPNLSKELIKLQNEINVYGYDLVTALRNRSFNSPSKKLSELFNGLATTITSGGNLPVFFDKRSQTLLFEHRLDVERQGKAAETFMDIYISVVIAAPMVLMLLLMMMSISGLGITLSPSTISLIMILAVSLINIFFLAFLHLRQPDKK